MRVQQVIERKLREAFEPLVLELANESGQHNVPPGSESHFRAVIVSEAFNGKRSVARHQMVYALLADELAGGVHALSLHTLTPVEWLERSGNTPASPACMGGSA
jgi:BolA family transcriptional regulator, general stress-responsive regulator